MSTTDMPKVRHAAVSGSFYPEDTAELKSMLADFFQPYSDQEGIETTCALIVPHAGYIFSGEVATAAYAQIAPDSSYEHIFLIGPAHRAHVNGASINYMSDAYQTPLGAVKVDTALAKELVDKNECFIYHPQADTEEHALEVQLPFLQYRLKEVPPIIPIVIGTESIPVIQNMAHALLPYFNSKNLFIISSDFSHYTAYDKACKADQRTGEAISEGDPQAFIEAVITNSDEKMKDLVTSACGQSAILLLLLLIHADKHIHIEHLLYRNSGDSRYGSKDQVVGYHAFAFERDNSPAQDIDADKSTTFSLTDKEKKTLLHIARQTIINRLLKTDTTTYDSSDLTPDLQTRCGAFVTLHERGKLRGCIGHIVGDKPLYKTIEEMAVAAAFNDPRFYALQKDELDLIDIEISVLTPLKRIYSADEFNLGIDGILIEKEGRSGTFLPQVASETGWSKEEFLGHCSRDKAGLGWNGWINANLYTYQAIVFSEDKLS